MSASRVEPATIRLRGIAAILARGVQRVRDSAEVPVEDPTVSQNLAHSLPEPLEIFADPSLSVSQGLIAATRSSTSLAELSQPNRQQMQSLLNAWSNVKNMKDEIRIRLSVGLIVVAVLHAVMLGAVFTALHRNPKPEQDTSWQVPPATPVPQVSRSIEKLPEPTQVNLEAQGELKQQYGSN